MPKIILINDEVQISDAIAEHPYKGVTGKVLASKMTSSGEIEHQIEFPRRSYTLDEMDRGEDADPNENIVWLLASEVEKIG